tara:strand:- start:389 stop:985 length:597 start_codon:yes stop_codon:yes gene_type:complete
MNYIEKLEQSDIFRYIKDKKVLEIGTAQGYYWNLYKKYNPLNITGLDPDDSWSLTDGVKRENIIKYGWEKYLPVTGYDVIIAYGVIYKLSSPLHFLETLVRSEPQVIMIEQIDRWGQPGISKYQSIRDGERGDIIYSDRYNSKIHMHAPEDLIVKAMNNMNYELVQKEVIRATDDNDVWMLRGKKSTKQFTFLNKNNI